MRLAEGLKVRQVAGQTLIVPVGKAVKVIHQTAVLNKDAAYFVSLMQGEFTIDNIVAQCLTHYHNVTEDVLRADVEKIVNAMKEAKMILDGDETLESLAQDSNSQVQVNRDGSKTISGTVRL